MTSSVEVASSSIIDDVIGKRLGCHFDSSAGGVSSVDSTSVGSAWALEAGE